LVKSLCSHVDGRCLPLFDCSRWGLTAACLLLAHCQAPTVPWFRIAPSQGTLPPGGNATLVFTLIPENIVREGANCCVPACLLAVPCLQHRTLPLALLAAQQCDSSLHCNDLIRLVFAFAVFLFLQRIWWARACPCSCRA
jgi:hypothetical protein